MSAISNTAIILCTSTIACVIIRMILPEGRTRKTMNLIITLFLILIMIAPVKNLFSKSGSFLISTPDEAEITKEYNSRVISMTQENIRNSVFKVLEQKNIIAENVYVSLNTDKQNGIYIDYISIYLSRDKTDETNDTVKVIEENFNITPEIILC